MDADARTEELRNLAAVMILGASGLTDELTDAEAQSLLDRCLVQAEAAVDGLTVRFDLAWLPVEDAREMIAERVAPVRRFMRAMNALAGKRRHLTPDQVFEELDALRTLAEELPLPPGAPVGDAALSTLAHWPTEPDNLGFVLAVLHVLEPGPVESSQMAWQDAETNIGDGERQGQDREDE